ncbi:hypothetical protein AB0I54_31820 [Streptomyces sp. NPDC050625]|uniref:hypothetical protein n=1 Tax=Streptomyces sp. NPDC050625 TaxID=3154629 RepID=UPI00341AA70B
MTTTTEIARAHGHTGPTNCQDCGTTESVHFGSWFNPETRESGNFLQCCACGLKAGDPIHAHTDCGAAITQYVLNEHSGPCSKLAYNRVHARALEAYSRAHHSALNHLNLEENTAHEVGLSAVLDEIGRAYAAAAIHQVAETLAGKLDEDTYVALGDIAATLDLEVVEDLGGANGTGEDEGPGVRVFHRADGWTMGDSPTPEACTTNYHRQQDGRPPCTDMAVWKVVESRGLVLSIGFYCEADLPAEHRHLATRA